MLELQQIPRGVLQEEGAVLDRSSFIPDAGFLIKLKLLLSRAAGKRLPILALRKDQTEVAQNEMAARSVTINIKKSIFLVVEPRKAENRVNA